MSGPLPMPRRAFTLLEVVLALAVFSVVAAGLFGTVRAVLQATAALRDSQRAANGIYGVFELCRGTFGTLPAPATLLSATYDGGPALPYELDLDNAPTAFTFGDRDFFYGEVAMTTHKEDDGSLTLGVEYRQLDTSTGLPLPNPLWLPLLKNVKEVRWSFYDPTAESWNDTWSDTTTRPSMVQLTLMQGDDPREWVQTFWLPTLAAQPTFSASGGGAASASRSSSASSSGGSRNASGSGNSSGTQNRFRPGGGGTR